MTSTQRSRSLWSWIVTVTLLFTLGCHWIYGSYELDPDVNRPGGLCRTGATRCNNENLLECSTDHSAWILDQTCASKEQCDSTNGCLICPQADMRRCNGAMIEACNAQRTQWVKDRECESAEMCSPVGCGPCNPPDVQCALDPVSGKPVIRECDAAEKTWKTRATCPTQAVCDSTRSKIQQDPLNWDGTCQGVCGPGQTVCDGATLLICSADQASYTKIPCESDALCKLTQVDLEKTPELKASIEACSPGCGAAGVPRCRDGRILERCSTDQTTWELVMECTGQEQCTTEAQGGCQVCEPGKHQCNGAVLERCDANNVWAPVSTCGSAALCKASLGVCSVPACPVSGENRCGTATDPLTEGNRLWECNRDRTAWVPGEVCATNELCSAKDKICKEPICGPGRRCNPTNRLLVEECNPGQTAWKTVATCKTEEFCVPGDASKPCHESCPGALMCNDRFLQTCSNESGIQLKAECLSKELCECALTGTCAGGTDATGCGVPVCGGVGGPNLRCTEGKSGRSLLQRCNTGRDGWNNIKDCESQALCSVDSSSCLVCPMAGQRQCAPDGLTTRVCSADRLSWNAESDCRAHGCYSGMYGPYCAPCDVGQLSCSGSKLQQCRQDEGGWEFKQDCEFGCIGSGNSVACATCVKDELRCSATGQLLKCSADQKTLTVQQTCANGCINSGNADYCAECPAGSTQCTSNKASTQTCGADGRWGTPAQCANGCVDSGTADYCSGCAAGEKRCSGNTLLTCNANRTMLGDPQACGADGCVDDDTADYCAACQQGEKRCMGADTVRTCAADRMSLVTPQSCTFGCRDSGIADFCLACAMGELRCDGNNLNVCRADQTALIPASTNCANGCFDGGLADYCGECKPGQTQCTTAGLQTCGNNGRWSAAQACANGCFGSAPQAYCGECTPGEDTQCTTGGVRSCTNAGRWATTTTACSRGCIDDGDSDFCAECSTGDHDCSSGMLLSCTDGRYMPPGTACELGCAGSKPNARCASCTNGDKRCNSAGTATELCMGGEWTSDMSCTNGCFTDTTGPFCGACRMGASECVTGGRRVCTNGRWGTAAPCPNGGACLDGQCVACTPGDTQCSGTDSLQTCTTSGTWGTAAPCDNDACLNDECVDCMPSDTQCASASTEQLCNAQGSWGTARTCPSSSCMNDACTECMPGDTECISSTQQRVCSAMGRWGAAATCPNGACVGKACGECSPGAAQCTMNNNRRQVCGTDGTWGMAANCEFGCVDNMSSDFCRTCEMGSTECVDDTMLRTCQDQWVTSSCPLGCVTDPMADYCAECMAADTSCTNGMVKTCTAKQVWGTATPCPGMAACATDGKACASP